MTTEDFPGGSEERLHRAHSATIAREVPDEEIASVRDVSFPIAMRGYDRAAVDAYVTRVNRIIAELQVSRSPRSAIRNALDQVSEETRNLLEQAHETAEKIAARSRVQADDRLQRAEAEARSVVRDAEARVAELDADAAAIRKERLRLIEDVQAVSEQLATLANVAGARFMPESAAVEGELPAAEEGRPAEEASFEAETMAIEKPPPLPEPSDEQDSSDESG